ncbi:hypothetical protein KI387_035555, partial [Taxus chinensis]
SQAICVEVKSGLFAETRVRIPPSPRAWLMYELVGALLGCIASCFGSLLLSSPRL